MVAVSHLPFSDYVNNRSRTFTDIGAFFERARHDPDFLAINTRRDLDRYCELKALKVGERAFVQQIWRAYEKALNRAERAAEPSDFERRKLR
jgi:hypothetical protein